MYLCCAGTNYQLCKNGFTRTSDPHEYCHNQFARTYQPLNIIVVIPVVDAPTLERVSHTMLAAKKVGNEVFDLSNEDGTFNQALWDKNVRIIREINETSGLALPEAVEVIEERKERQKKEAAEKRTELVQKRKAEREAEREAEAAEKKRRRKEAKAEKQRINAEKQAEAMAIKHAQTSEAISGFIKEHCKYGADYIVSIADFKEAYARLTKDSMTGEAMRKKLDQKGIVIVQRKGLKTIKGLCLKS